MAPAPVDAGSLDVLAGWAWECRWDRADADPEVGEKPADETRWVPAIVPGTAAGALRALGQWQWGNDDTGLLDGSEWWYRCHFEVPEDSVDGPWQLELDGLATVADAWVNGEHLLHSENMWIAHHVPLDRLAPHNELLVRFAALAPLLAARRPRPRWRTLLLRSQNQRWFRTTLLGRVPGWAPSGAPVGPWRPVRLRRTGVEPLVVEQQVRAACDGPDGTVSLRLVLEGVAVGTGVE
jgi:beta-mannosidase